MLTKVKPTTLLQIFCEFMNNSKVTFNPSNAKAILSSEAQGRKDF